MCGLGQDEGRRIELDIQCSLYHGQQGDLNQSVRVNYKPVFEVGQNMTAVGAEGMHQYICMSYRCINGGGGAGDIFNRFSLNSQKIHRSSLYTWWC